MDFQTLGTSPINETNPTGEDIRYQPVFEALQAEVDKLSSPTAAASSIDWAKIASAAAEILSTQSKDLLVAAYFCVAQIHLSSIEGLELGLHVYADILENFWDTVFPQARRMRGRIAAIEWWIEKSGIAIETMKPNRISGIVRDRIVAKCNSIDQILAGCLLDPRPEMHAIMRAIEAIPLEIPRQLSPPTESAEQAQSGTTVLPESGSSPPPQPETEAMPPPDNPPQTKIEIEAKSSLDSLLMYLRENGTALLEQDLSDPMPYRLVRFSLWATIIDLPPAVDGKTLIPPPDPQIASILRDIFNRGDWSSMVTAAEFQLPQYILWLDLNRFASIALENLGTPYKKAADCVAQETAFLISRLSGLSSLKFSDGTPLADKETCDWLQSISLGGATLSLDQAMAEGSVSDPITARLTEVMQQALVLVKEKNLIGAVSLFQQEMRLTYPVKDRMLWRLALCRILFHSKNAALAVPHFDQILEDIETYRLEAWDPMLALQGLKVIWAGFQRIPEKEAKERATLVLHQISRIDPAEALRIGK